MIDLEVQGSAADLIQTVMVSTPLPVDHDRLPPGSGSYLF